MAFVLLLALCAISAVQAHLQLEYPAPFNASNNPHRQGPADDIYVYPMGCCDKPTTAICRGYLGLLGTPQGAPVATWEAGSNVTWNITGAPAITLNDLGGTHYGGSCQVGFSTDQGKTFRVAASYEGNCPHRNSPRDSGQNFDLTVPAELPAGEAVFAWTWVNREQEFTMNCAAVTITNKNDGGSSSSAVQSSVPATSAPESSSGAAASTTQASAAPSSSGTSSSGTKHFSLQWCSCECETSTQTTDEEDAYDADGCTCQCWKPPKSISKRDAHMVRHVHHRRAPSSPHHKQGDVDQPETELQQKRAAAWATFPSMFIPDPIWHDCKLPLTTAELKYPDPGAEVVMGDGEYPLELPSDSGC